MGTLAIVVLMFVSVGVVCGTVSAVRAGIPRAVIVRDARYWYVAWIILLVLAIVL
jgi:hypothetical protein